MLEAATYVWSLNEEQQIWMQEKETKFKDNAKQRVQWEGQCKWGNACSTEGTPGQTSGCRVQHGVESCEMAFSVWPESVKNWLWRQTILNTCGACQHCEQPYSVQGCHLLPLRISCLPLSLLPAILAALCFLWTHWVLVSIILSLSFL